LTLASVFAQILTALGIDVKAVEDFLARSAAQFPDLKSRTDALAAFLESQVTNLPVNVAATLKGLAADIAAGVSGVDPNAWKGSG
jgi:hypothetical protein